MMTLSELIALANDLLTRVGANRVSGADIKEVVLAIINFFASQLSDIIPSWTTVQTFQTDGSDAGKYCKYADSNGKLRLFETKVDDNINNAPPLDPGITENAYWKEISASASAALPEWAAGVYGPGLIIVYFDHPDDGQGLYMLTEATRPFASTDIVDEIEADQWDRIDVPQPRFIEVDTTDPVIILNMRNLAERMFNGSDNITADCGWQLSNDDNAVKIPSLRFSTDAGVVHTFPANFRMNNGLWIPADKTWTPDFAGEYEAAATYNGTTWILKIEGPY